MRIITKKILLIFTNGTIEKRIIIEWEIGKVKLSGISLNYKQINLSDNAKGIYFLEIRTNNSVVNKKLIIK